MEGTTHRIALHTVCCAVIALTAGCAALAPARPAAAGSPLQAHAWTMPACPSEVTPTSGLPAPVLGGAADLLLDRIAAALTAAATADREGVAWSGTDARYLHFGRALGADAGGPPAAVLAGCVVVALVEGAGSRPAGWCAAHDTAPGASPAFDAPCSPEGRRLLAAAERGLSLSRSAGGGALPHLYAEVRLQPSRDGKAIAPRVANLYYPHALQVRPAATRDLAFTLQLRLPGETKGAGLFVLLRELVPGKPLYDPEIDLAPAGTLWTAVPAFSGRELTPADAHEGLTPVNIVTEIRETGDTNLFLQALAAAFGAAREVIEDALK